MAAIGAKYKWVEGKIVHASRLWKSPTKRRIPRMLIEGRAMEVGVLLYIQEPWLIFEETTFLAERIDTLDAEKLEYYYGRYHLLPAIFKRQDTYEWLKKPGNALLLWGKDGRYYVKAASKGR